jgi:hypothetical protein
VVEDLSDVDRVVSAARDGLCDALGSRGVIVVVVGMTDVGSFVRVAVDRAATKGGPSSSVLKDEVSEVMRSFVARCPNLRHEESKIEILVGGQGGEGTIEGGGR